MNSYQVQEWGRPLQAVLSATPRPTGSQVLLRVKACGVCHSDVHIGDGVYELGGGKRARLADLGFRLPLTMGHEIVGVVVAAGPQAEVEIGARCVVFPWIGCGTCRHCLHDNEIDCEAPASLGIRQAGGYSDHVLVPHSRYVLPHEGIDPLVAASAACSGITAYSALKKLGPCTPEDTVVLIGAGGLGLAALGLIRRLNPARVVVVDSDPRKLELAKPHADAVLDINDPGSAEALKEFASGGAAGIIDFVGLPQTFDWAMPVLRKGATLIVVGLFGGGVSLALPLLPMRNLRLLGSYVGTLSEFKELLALLRAGAVPNVPLIPRPLEEINQMLEEVRLGQVLGRLMAVPSEPAATPHN